MYVECSRKCFWNAVTLQNYQPQDIQDTKYNTWKLIDLTMIPIYDLMGGLPQSMEITYFFLGNNGSNESPERGTQKVLTASGEPIGNHL